MVAVQEQRFYRVEEVAEVLHISIPTAYRVIKQLNDELKAKGMITVSGRVSRKYFEEKVYM